jgi:hypothetical protein
MTEQHCDQYINQIEVIRELCREPTTTKTQLENALSVLDYIDGNFIDDFESMDIPSTFSHFNKFITISNFRASKNLLHYYLVKFINMREKYVNIFSEEHTYEETCSYIAETKVISDFIDDLINSCTCMCSRKTIINNTK